MRYDLLGLGLRVEWLGTPRLSWLDLSAVVTQRPLSSALSRSIDGESAFWGVPEHLLALIADILQAGNWQRGGGKGSKPAPIPRPGVGPKKTSISARTFDAMTIDEFERRNAKRQKGGE